MTNVFDRIRFFRTNNKGMKLFSYLLRNKLFLDYYDIATTRVAGILVYTSIIRVCHFTHLYNDNTNDKTVFREIRDKLKIIIIITTRSR